MFLWKLLVDERHHGRGIGRAIVERSFGSSVPTVSPAVSRPRSKHPTPSYTLGCMMVLG
jgi:hypothetical protein